MRIDSHTIDISMQNITSSSTTSKSPTKVDNTTETVQQIKTKVIKEDDQQEVTLKMVTKENLEEAVSSINKFLHLDQKHSKFVLHDGLDKYFVRLVDSETEEVIKEIPPERLLDAFYEMQKLAGMIVDEKI